MRIRTLGLGKNDVLAYKTYGIRNHIRWSANQLTTPYLNLLQSMIMKTQNTWNKMVHAPFKKVIAFDLICMGIGIVIGMGIGVYLVAGV